MINSEINAIKDRICMTIMPKRIYLFGSFAKDTYNEDSDYDFYIDWGGLCSKINRLLDDTALLMKLGKAEPAVSASLQFFRSLDGLDDEDIFYDPPAVLSDCCMKAGNLLTEASVHDSVPAGKKTEIVKDLLKLSLAENLPEMYDMDGLFLDINSRVNSPDASVELIDRQIGNMRNLSVVSSSVTMNCILRVLMSWLEQVKRTM